MRRRVALITGITGQDGFYLARHLLSEGYQVHGLRRRTSFNGSDRLQNLSDTLNEGGSLTLHHGDMTDQASLIRVLQESKPDEIYNLAAQSHVQVSFEKPAYTTAVNALGVVHLLEAVRLLGLAEQTRLYQASTSEMYGVAESSPQSETTPFRPRSPYAAAKVFAHHIMVNYREAYGFHASNGICFNHEGPERGETFVSRKITLAAAARRLGDKSVLMLGNLSASRDWGHAADFVVGMQQMLQQPHGDDYVLATGVARSVRQFAEAAFRVTGIDLAWEGEGLDERGVDRKSGAVIIAVDPRHFRPSEVQALIGDASKAKEAFGWEPRISFEEMVREMVESDTARMRKEP
ncbi:MAG: GDP-mannose 4,6-dehydratase [Alphaproteobacteria bacterium]|nr:GDP-mannose 4,6-dehydratase [Alphaproteobacteria bacterium]